MCAKTKEDAVKKAIATTVRKLDADVREYMQSVHGLIEAFFELQKNPCTLCEYRHPSNRYGICRGCLPASGQFKFKLRGESAELLEALHKKGIRTQ